MFIFARARWFFKWIVWLCAAIILLSGVISSYSHWDDYNRDSNLRRSHRSQRRPTTDFADRPAGMVVGGACQLRRSGGASSP